MHGRRQYLHERRVQRQRCLRSPCSRQQHRLHRQQRLHPRGLVPIGHMSGGHAGHLQRQHRLHHRQLRFDDGVLERQQAQRHHVRRRQRVHHGRQVHERAVRRNGRRLQRQQSLYGGHLQSSQSAMRADEPAGWHTLHRQQQVHAQRHVPERTVHGGAARRLFGHQSLYHQHLRSCDGMQGRTQYRGKLRRRRCLHDRGEMSEHHLRWRGTRRLRRLSRKSDLQSHDGCLQRHTETGRRALRRRRRLPRRNLLHAARCRRG